MDVTIVIPTIRANPDLLSDCLEAVADTAPDAEVLVMDHGTFSENCNRGASQAQGDWLLFLNDDCLPQPGWYDAMLDAGYQYSGIVGARLLYPDGQIQHSGIVFDADPPILTPRNRTWDVPSGHVEAVTGACLLIDMDIWQELGGFDEGYRNGAEDVDFCLRALVAGYRPWYCAEATVIHYESASGELRWRWVRENIERFNATYSVS